MISGEVSSIFVIMLKLFHHIKEKLCGFKNVGTPYDNGFFLTVRKLYIDAYCKIQTEGLKWRGSED